jgi:hypothetical protein
MFLFALAAVFFVLNLWFAFLALINGEYAIMAVHMVALILMIDTMRSNINHFRKK